MKVILITLISVFLAAVLQTAYSPTNIAERPYPAPEVTPTAKDSEKNNDAKKPINLHLSIKDTTCVRPLPCKVVLDIKNPSDQDIDMELALGIRLGRYSSDPRITPYEFNSPLDINTLENLQPNQYPRFVLKGNQHIEKDIDLAKIKWLKTVQSSWHFYDLWEQVTEGKYTVSAGLSENPKNIDPKRIKKDAAATKAVGKKDVIFVNIEPVLSITANSLIIDFKEK